MTGSSPSAEELNTWQEIAAYLGISVREAQYREKNDALPIHRLPGKKPRVWARRDELDAWRKLVDVASPANSLAPAGVVPPASDPASGDAGPPHRKWLLRPARLVIVIVPAILVLAAIVGWRVNPLEPAILAVEEPNLVVRTSGGREIWRYPFKDGFAYEEYTPREIRKAYWIADADGDGHKETFFRYSSFKVATEGSSLYCFNDRGVPRWIYRVRKTVRDSGGNILPNYRMGRPVVVRDPASGRYLIAVAGNHYSDQPSQLALIAPSGRLVADYWHPGHINYLDSTTTTGNRPLLILGGVNNGEHRATLIALDPFALTGSSTPYRMRDPRFRILDMPEAREEAVVLFPRSCLSRDEPYTRVNSLDVGPHSIYAVVAESHNATSPRGVYYEFDRTLRLRRLLLSTEYYLEHRQWERRGDLNHPGTSDEAQLANAIEYRRAAAR